ncbi:MAG: hypothetical protein NT023_07315 [Armatimonadetes bacterium]|nr:hypothetical protein [Armatimonadota bacterium]
MDSFIASAYPASPLRKVQGRAHSRRLIGNYSRSVFAENFLKTAIFPNEKAA